MRPAHRVSPVLALRFAAALCCLLLAAPQAMADDLGFFASRRVLSDADAALHAGHHEQAAELYSRVVDGTSVGKSRHARALLGAAVCELSHDGGDIATARQHLDAYLADPAAEEKFVARALRHLIGDGQADPIPPPMASEAPAAPAASPARDASKDQARIADLQRQLVAAKDEIKQKEKVIEELRKIVVEGGG